MGDLLSSLTELTSGNVTDATIVYADKSSVDYKVQMSSVWTYANSKLSTAIAANGIVARTAASTYAARTITGTSDQITVTNGDGVSGNPTLSLPSHIILDGTETSVAQDWSQISQTYDLNPSASASSRSYYGHNVSVASETGNTETFAGIYGIYSSSTLRSGATTTALDSLTGFANNYGTAGAIKAGWIAATNYGDVSSGFAYGIETYVHNWANSSGTGNIATARGLRIRMQNSCVNTASAASGDANITAGQLIYANLSNSTDVAGHAATLGTVAGFQYDITNSALSTITTSYGILLTTPSNSGTLTNHYGIYLQDQTVSGTTLNYAIYSAGGLNYFAGATTCATSLLTPMASIKYDASNGGQAYSASDGGMYFDSNLTGANTVVNASKPQWRFYLSQAGDAFGVQRSAAGAVWSPTTFMKVDASGNLCLGHALLPGTSATKTAVLQTGTAPSDSPADAFQIYSADQAAGNACFHTRTEGGAIVKLYQQAHIIDPDTDTTNLMNAVKSILTTLENTGLLATS